MANGIISKKNKKGKRNKALKAKKLQWKIRKDHLVDYICTEFSEVANNRTSLKICENVNNGNNSAIPGPSNIACHFGIPDSPNPSCILRTTTPISKSEVQIEISRIMNNPFNFENVPKKKSVISGNRIVELGYVLDWAIDLQYKHSKICTDGKLYVHKEIRINKGLSSSIIFKCTLCDVVLKHETEANREKPEINTGAVWGTIATGSSFGHLEELLSCMNIPCMPSNMFYDIENLIGVEWRKSLWCSMEAAGIIERNRALEMGQVCADGVPWITVYVDGSWSKRSYGTNFNSLSGMVGIIGRHTKQLLFIAVRNKFCCICEKAENKDIEPNEHVCYKNWNESAPSMEADMVVEGC